MCLVTMHNNSTQSLLHVEITGEVTSPQGLMQPTGLRYDGFLQEAGIPPGEALISSTLAFGIMDTLTSMESRFRRSRGRISSATPSSRCYSFSLRTDPHGGITRPKRMSWQGGPSAGHTQPSGRGL
jgi:hypothetical protein